MSARTAKNDDLHGNAPDRCRAALLIIDMINDLDFPGNEELVCLSVDLARNVAALKRRCSKAGIPTIYVNDNCGKWRSDFREVVKHCSNPSVPGSAMSREVTPGPEDYFVLKPKHSAFYATPLDTLLQYIGVETLMITGISTNSCVMLTASDAYVRDFRLFIPEDCVIGQNEEQQRVALEFMEKNFGARTFPSGELDLSSLPASRDEDEPAA